MNERNLRYWYMNRIFAVSMTFCLRMESVCTLQEGWTRSVFWLIFVSEKFPWVSHDDDDWYPCNQGVWLSVDKTIWIDYKYWSIACWRTYWMSHVSVSVQWNWKDVNNKKKGPTHVTSLQWYVIYCIDERFLIFLEAMFRLDDSSLIVAAQKSDLILLEHHLRSSAKRLS